MFAFSSVTDQAEAKARATELYLSPSVFLNEKTVIPELRSRIEILQNGTPQNLNTDFQGEYGYEKSLQLEWYESFLASYEALPDFIHRNHTLKLETTPTPVYTLCFTGDTHVLKKYWEEHKEKSSCIQSIVFYQFKSDIFLITKPIHNI